MWFYIVAAIVLVAFATWFVRTNAFRHRRQGQGRDPGQSGSYKAL
jgi:hypothetical protein